MLPSQELRLSIRRGAWSMPTSGLCPGFIQAKFVHLQTSLTIFVYFSVVILPHIFASPFALFCKQNSSACPVLEILPPGETCPTKYCCAIEDSDEPTADIRTDVPKYRVFRQGDFIEEVTDVRLMWREDLSTFLIGCSFSFEKALQAHGIPIRNIEEGKNVSMYRTNRRCHNEGVEEFFDCVMVVTMRPVKQAKIDTAIRVTKEFTTTHGGPIYFGYDFSTELGIQDLARPDFGDPVTVDRDSDDVPMFWACGVTAMLAAKSCKSDLLVTHSPGHMFVTDIQDDE